MNESLVLHPRYKALFEVLLKDNILSYSDKRRYLERNK
jgi:hypothetical protein